MILDDIEKDYFPKDPIQDALSPEVLDRLLPETEKTCYDLKMRIGEYLNYFVRKVSASTNSVLPLINLSSHVKFIFFFRIHQNLPFANLETLKVCRLKTVSAISSPESLFMFFCFRICKWPLPNYIFFIWRFKFSW